MLSALPLSHTPQLWPLVASVQAVYGLYWKTWGARFSQLLMARKRKRVRCVLKEAHLPSLPTPGKLVYVRAGGVWHLMEQGD